MHTMSHINAMMLTTVHVLLLLLQQAMRQAEAEFYLAASRSNYPFMQVSL